MPVVLPPSRFDNATDGLLTAVARGDVLYRGAAAWNNLPAGTAGMVLTTGGPGADPAWAPAGGTVAPDFLLTRAGAAAPPDPRYFTITPGADTALTASVEANDVLWSLNRTQQFATGALATQRAVWIRPPTYAFVGASTIDTAATLAVSGAPVAGANATLTRKAALWLQTGSDAGTGLLIWPNSASQTAYMLEFQTYTGSFIGGFGYNAAQGVATLGLGTTPDLSGGVLLQVRGSSTNAIQMVVTNTSGSMGSFYAYGASVGDIAPGITGNNSAAFLFAPVNSGVGALEVVGAHDFHLTINSVGLFSVLQSGFSGFNNPTPQGQLHVLSGAAATKPLIVEGTASQTGILQHFRGKSSTTAGRDMAKIDAVWAVSTDASRQGRLVLYGSDSGGDREGFRLEGTGSAAALAFFGGAAVVQQANASQAAITAVTDANAKSALQAIYNLLHAYNLAPATA